jgi:hypothetical protein
LGRCPAEPEGSAWPSAGLARVRRTQFAERNCGAVALDIGRVKLWW